MTGVLSDVTLDAGAVASTLAAFCLLAASGRLPFISYRIPLFVSDYYLRCCRIKHNDTVLLLLRNCGTLLRDLGLFRRGRFR